MNRPRDSLLTLFDPLFSTDPATPPPPPRRDAPSPDLGSDKENAAPSASDSPITLTKFFNRIYTLRKAQPSRPMPAGRLVDLGDSDADDDNDGEPESDDGGKEQHALVVNHAAVRPAGGEEEARDSPPRRPLADIAVRDGPFLAVKPLRDTAAPSSSLFGSPSPFKLVSPTPAPSSSPLASVINAINGATSRSSSSSPPSTPSAPRIAITLAEPSSPSPAGRQLRPDTMRHAAPGVDVDADPLRRRTSVDLQEAMSVHFDEASSFDLLKDKILFPENDSLDGDLDLDMVGTLAVKLPEDGDLGDTIVLPIGDANDESDSEMSCVGSLGERLRDMNIMEDGVLQNNKDGDRGVGISTPSKCNSYNIPTPQAPVRQFLRPKNNKIQVAVTCNNAPPQPPHIPSRRSARSSISSVHPVPAATSTALQNTKKERPKPGMTMMAPSIPARKPVGGNIVHSAQQRPQSQLLPPRASAGNMALGGVQRPPANVAHSRAMSVSSSATSVRMQPQPMNKPIGAPVAPSSSKMTVASAKGLRRPSGLPAPMSRVGASGIAVSRASVSGGAGAGVARRVSMTVGGGGVAGRLGSTGANKMGPVMGDGQAASARARMMRRV